jgi:hypothetical protein
MNLTRTLSALVLGAALLSGCGGGVVPFTGSERVVGADGEARWEEIAGGAVLVELEMTNLPPPNRVGNGLMTYVVWFIPAGGQATRVGALEYDADDREGHMTATNVSKQFQVLVTAESSASVSSPGDNTIARFSIDAR